MPGYTKTSQSVRQNYAIAKGTLEAANINASQTKLTQHTLRFEATLTSTSTSIQFGVLVNQSSPGVTNGSSYNTENKLNLQDAFFCHEIGLFLAKASSTSDTTFRLNTYPDAGQFTTGATNLYTIYNSKLSLSVDNNQVVPFLDCQRFLNIPNPNYSAATNAQIAAIDGTTQGFTPIEPMLIFNGTQNIVLQLNLPAAISTLDANTRVVVMLRGHLAQNVGINLKQLSQI